MNLLPITQKKLYNYDIFFNEIVRLENNNKLPNKILLSGAKGLGKSTMAYHIINYIFSKNEESPYNLKLYEINENNRSYKLLKNFSHPNFYSIDLLKDEKNIEINQIRKMIEYTNKSSFNNSLKIILINNVELLNPNSINALLKVTEEPNNKILFILIHNSYKKILKTLKSRCLLFKINFKFNDVVNITNKILGVNILEIINTDLINYYNTPGDYIKLIKFSQETGIDLNSYDLKKFLIYIIEEKYYQKNNFIKKNIYNYIEFYFLKLFTKSINRNAIMNYYTNFINKTNDTNKFNLDYESLFMEFKSKILNE